MRKLIKRTFYSILILLILLVGLLSFFLTSTPGLYTMMRLSTLYFPGTLKVHHLNGRLFDQFSVDELDYQNTQTIIKIKHLNVNWNIRSILAHQLIVKNLNAAYVEIKQGDLITDLTKVKLTGELNKQGLKINSLQFNCSDQTLYGHLQIDAKPPYIVSGNIKLNPYQQTKKILTGILDISGELNQLQWAGEFHGHTDISLNGSLKKLVQLNLTGKWRNFQGQTTSKSTFNSPEGRVKIYGTIPNLNIELTSKINKSLEDNWKLAAIIQGTVPWQWNFDISLSQPIDPSSKHEGFYTSLTAKGTIKDKNQGTMILTVNPGHYQMPDDSILPLLKFQGGILNASLSPQQFTGTGSFAIDGDKKLKLIFNLPKYDLSKGLSSKQPIFAELSLFLNSFAFLQEISPDISNAKGSLAASLKTKGTLGKTTTEGKLTLNQASMDIPKLGLNLTAIDFTVLSKKQNWDAKGSLLSGGKKLILKGQGPLNSSLSGDLSLQGTDVPIINTKEYQIKISPKLNLNLSPSTVNITGSILIPFAQIRPQTFSNSIALSEDIIFKTKNKTLPPTAFKTNMDINVEMGNEVELNFKGLHANLAGIVNLKKLHQSPLSATGELTVKEGKYKAYAQDLDIEQGQLIFTGGQLDNPGINLRASKKIDTSTSSASGSNQPFDFNNNNLQNANVRGVINIGVEVSGRLSAPKILLFSNPAILSQADILSMMVLGRPASQANKAGGQLLLAAISSMNLGNGTNGTQLLEQLKKNLGFDLNIQTTSNYNLATNQISDSTGVVVGKSISKRIYLSYNVGLSQADSNVLILKYLLNKFYSIQVSSSTKSNAIDVLYTSSK